MFSMAELIIDYVFDTYPIAHSQNRYHVWEWKFPPEIAVTGFSQSRIKCLTKMLIPFQHRRQISDEKQITFCLNQNGIAIPVHSKFFRVQRNISMPIKITKHWPNYFMQSNYEYRIRTETSFDYVLHEKFASHYYTLPKKSFNQCGYSLLTFLPLSGVFWDPRGM